VVQARYGSRRFPGKVLAEFQGKKVLAHVLEAVGEGCGRQNVVLATSDTRQDNPVAEFAQGRGWRIHRGNLENVWSRFREVTDAAKAEWIIRVCADSPLMPASLIQSMIRLVRPGFDLVTNVHPRTFPHGQSVEILNRRLFLENKYFPQTHEDREHVTAHLYRMAGIRILNHWNPRGDQSSLAWSVEEPGDIGRLEKLCAG
jgi:spore coat polysaccharide biosynthesis protein SpsF (cytidylyltransferase family)